MSLKINKFYLLVSYNLRVGTQWGHWLSHRGKLRYRNGTVGLSRHRVDANILVLHSVALENKLFVRNSDTFRVLEMQFRCALKENVCSLSACTHTYAPLVICNLICAARGGERKHWRVIRQTICKDASTECVRLRKSGKGACRRRLRSHQWRVKLKSIVAHRRRLASPRVAR
jgi:hypothetical protein